MQRVLLRLFLSLIGSCIYAQAFTETLTNRLLYPFCRHTNKSSSRSPANLVAFLSTMQDAYGGKNILLTGATGGLGQALALELAPYASKICLSARNADSLKASALQLQKLHPVTVHCFVCNLDDPQSVDKLAQDVLKLCPVDVLINNGGVSSRSDFRDTSLDVDRRVMQINFWAGVALVKALAPAMVHQRGGGKIIWISSVQGLMGLPSRSSYAASKFAVQGYCESIRAELAADGVTVHTVSPGYIRTNLSQSAITGDGTAYGKTDATTAAGADPHDVAVELLHKVAKGRVDFVVAATFSAKVALWLKFCCPALLRMLLVKRYNKSLKEKED